MTQQHSICGVKVGRTPSGTPSSRNLSIDLPSIFHANVDYPPLEERPIKFSNVLDRAELDKVDLSPSSATACGVEGICGHVGISDDELHILQLLSTGLSEEKSTPLPWITDLPANSKVPVLAST